MSEKIFTVFFVAFIGILLVMNIVGKDKLFSEQENRVLTQKPALTWERFKSGKFTSEVEKYISDQFPLKNSWVGVKGKVEKAIGKKENNGVLFGKDGYLFERFTRENDRLEKNIEIIDSFAKRTTKDKTYLLLAPTAIDMYPEKVPRFVTSVSQKEILANIKQSLSSPIQLIDAYDGLVQKKDEAIYFKTDHHWTMRGAYLAYVEAANQMGFKALSISDYNIEIASDSFHGTLYSKATAYDLPPDILELFIPKQQLSVEVSYEDGRKTQTLFERDHLTKKDKYAVFLDGNHSLVKIKTGLSTDRKLTVIKDSYAHAFIPFLAMHYDEIHVIDLRYFKEDVQQYMKSHDMEELLFLYNLPNFTEDVNFGLLL